MTMQELYEKNEGLVFAVINREFHGAMDDDTLQIGRMGLWRACLCWDEKNGTAFSTYAYIAIKNAIVASHEKDFRKPELHKDVTMIPLDKVIKNEEDNEAIGDLFLGNEDAGYRYSELKDILKNTLNGREMKIVMLMNAGYKQTEIARKMGTTRQNVSRIVVDNIQKKLVESGYRP